MIKCTTKLIERQQRLGRRIIKKKWKNKLDFEDLTTKYFLAVGELQGVLSSSKNELEFLSSEQMNHLVKEADIGSCHDEYMPLEIRKRKLKEIIKLINEVL